MSIRLRLTLLYTAILALTLLAFSAVLYAMQARYTLTMVERDLLKSAEPMAAGWMRAQHELGWRAPLPGMIGVGGPEGEQARQVLQPLIQDRRQRDMLRILDAHGVAFTIPQNEGGAAFPLSAAGLKALQVGKVWIEITHDDEGRLLVYNRPVVVNGEVAGIVQLARSLADRDRALRSLGATLLVGSGLMTLLAFGAGWTLSGITLRPIHRITQTAHEIGAARDFSSRVAHTGPNDELGQLATTFNEMLAQLEEGYRQVTRALQVQRDFVADVSHELRTPLTTIRGNLALLERQPPLPNADRADILSDLIGESERLSRLVSDLLVLARSDAGRKLELGPVEVKTVVEDVCRQGHLLAGDREINIAGPAGLIAHANEDALKQVLLILLDNAIKHTRGPITLTLSGISGYVAIRVQDAGPGLSPELQARIFDRFYRSDASRSTPGFGLGLAIARALTEAQHGRLDVESQVGQGSAFVVQLPCEA